MVPKYLERDDFLLEIWYTNDWKEGKNMDKETLKMLADKLMFTMREEEYETLAEEFKVILKQMDLIGNIENIERVSPMVYPHEGVVALREDLVLEELPIEDILCNSGSNLYNQVKLPKVVE